MTDAPNPDRPQDADVTLEYLLRRMRFKSDFPALSTSIARVQALSESDTENLQTLCDEILQDVALTQKLLRVVNTAHFRRAGTDQISTISRAVALIGVAGVRNMALSLMLLDHMPDKGHAHQLKVEFLRSVMAGTLAAELSRSSKEAEQVYIGALFRNLGRLLVAFYLPEDAEQIRVQMEDAELAGKPLDARQASEQVLGMSYDALGQAVGGKWGLPDALLTCMAEPDGAVPSVSLAARPDRVVWLASLANEGALTMLQTDPADLGGELEKLTAQYARALDLAPHALQDAAGRARKRMTEMTDALNLSVPAHSPAERLLETFYVDAPNADQAGPDPADLGLDSQSAVLSQHVPELAEQTPSDILAAGIQDITNTLVEQFRLNDVLQMILETMLRALDCRRVVFCLKDPKSGALLGRIGMGEGADAVKAVFKVPVDRVQLAQADLFAAVCLKNLDTLIADASKPAVVSRLPEWFKDHVQAPTFLLLPMVVKRGGQDIVLGLIYADKGLAGSLKIDERELSLLRTLRNQAVMAFKQSAGG
ncbi:HDOD domain-containing protein [Aquabacterium sp.]|uniref:HDOD domain-containing protein n=1 Tax=Aquabacterium sp. TaxID=1872578 RepID=UPI002E338C0E|nr:HDOD domain-containing protein [Aquabacterium sp.]HEX5311939.1 HDOD domain-containing protein [Aquabacterium sp.]